MLRTLRTLCALWNDEAGVIISAELVLVLTITVLAMVVGLHAVAKAVVMELGDLGAAFGALDQTFCFQGFRHAWHAHTKGSAFIDTRDDCDCVAIVQVPPIPHMHQTGMGPEHGGNFHH